MEHFWQIRAQIGSLEMPRFFVKIGKNVSGMPPEFCLFVIGGKEMLLYLIGQENKAKVCFCVCKGDFHTTRSAQNTANAEQTFKMAITSSENYSGRVEIERNARLLMQM